MTGRSSQLIVTDHGDGGLRVIRQTDHARAAAEIAAHWSPARVILKELWHPLLRAVEHHDDGWDEAEMAPSLNAQGELDDFKSIPTEKHITI